MTDLPVDYLAAGVLHALYDLNNEKVVHSFTIDNLHKECVDAFEVNFDIGYTRAAVSRLLQLGVVRYLEDPFADHIVTTHDDDIIAFFNDRADVEDIYSKTWKFELDWLKTAFAKDSFWKSFDDIPDIDRENIAPASDRIVTLDHNNPELEDIKAAAALLRENLKKSNDVGELSADQIQVAVSEVEQIEADLNAGVIRLSGFRLRASSTLSWIGREAAGALIGTAALALLAAIAAFFGFSV